MTGKKPIIGLRPPPIPTSVESFVSGQATTPIVETGSIALQSQESPSAMAPKRRGAKAPTQQGRVERKRQHDGAKLRRIHPWINRATERALARYCVENEVSLSDAVDAALRAYLRMK